MYESACLTCVHARKGKGAHVGQVLCFLSGQPQNVSHVCRDFLPLVAASGFRSGFLCNTRTNCTGVQK